MGCRSVWGAVGLPRVALAVREGRIGCAGAKVGRGPVLPLPRGALTNARFQAHWERPQQHICQAGEADNL